MKSIKSKILFFVIYSIIICQNPDNLRYKNSAILDVPNLSFSENVYSGLDILDQMDFRLLKDKTIIVLTNHTALIEQVNIL